MLRAHTLWIGFRIPDRTACADFWLPSVSPSSVKIQALGMCLAGTHKNRMECIESFFACVASRNFKSASERTRSCSQCGVFYVTSFNSKRTIFVQKHVCLTSDLAWIMSTNVQNRTGTSTKLDITLWRKSPGTVCPIRSVFQYLSAVSCVIGVFQIKLWIPISLKKYHTLSGPHPDISEERYISVQTSVNHV